MCVWAGKVAVYRTELELVPAAGQAHTATADTCVDPSHFIRYTGRTRERDQRAGEGGELSEITTAIAARQAQITQLQSDIETLQRAASIVGRKGTTAKATSQPKPKTKPQPKTKRKRKRRPWSAASKKAMSKRIKAYWAKRRKARR